MKTLKKVEIARAKQRILITKANTVKWLGIGRKGPKECKYPPILLRFPL
mgnify:CR=1 FL=1